VGVKMFSAGRQREKNRFSKIGSKSFKDTDFLTEREADIVLLFVKSKQLYTDSIGGQKCLVFGKTLKSNLTLKFSHSEFQLFGYIYCYDTKTSFLTSPIYYKLKNTQ
jgi:hypothetical protein